MSFAMRVLPLGLLALGCGSVEDTEDRMVACTNGTVDVLENGNFDAADPPWRQDPPGLLCGEPEITPDSGTVAACLGGVDGMVSSVSRDVFLPEGAASARLTGRICISTEEAAAAEADVLAFDLIDGVAAIGALGKRSNQQGTAACQFETFMLETQLSSDPFSATLRVQSTLNANLPTSFFVDSLALTVACE
jgi:hypothetical protein